MAQHDYVIANGTGAAVRSDLNAGFAAIVSQNSGATAPSTTYAYQSWADTSAGVMKMRNGANNAWITLYQLDGEWTSIAFENGTAAAPSIYFKDSGTDTGIYSPGADQVAISTGGTVRLTTTTTGITSALPVDVPLGAVGTPSITFTGDLNTGIYSPGADQVAIATGGVQRINIDSSGNLQLGTTTQKNTLIGGSGTGMTIGGASAPNLTVWDTSDASYATFLGQVDATSYLFNYANGAMIFGTNNTERARIDSSGNMGIGVVPSSQFSTVKALQIGALGATIICGNTSAGGTSAFGQNYYVDPSTADFKYAASSYATTNYTQSQGEHRWFNAPSGTAGNTITFTQAMTLNSTGSFTVIGAVSAAGGTHTIRDSGSSPDTLRLYNNTDSNNTGNRFLICDAGASVLRAEIRTNGGLANYSANNANLSDRNAKKDISLAADTWNCVKEWEIVNYRYNDQPDDADLNLGVIAQQVAESCPEVITVFQEAKEATEDAPAQEERLGVKEQQMYWMAIKALQEAIARIETLETEVSALKGA